MKIGFFADLHAKISTPRCRTDDYFTTIKKKFYEIIDITNVEGCDIVVQAGDFFDDHKQPYHLTNWFLETIQGCWACSRIFGVAGQHDMVNHALTANTPFQTMVHSGSITLLGAAPFHFPGKNVNDKDVHIYGQSWGEETPKIRRPEFFNVLVIHETLVQNKIWEGQKNPKFAIDFLKNNKFDLIICGDNHKPFIETYRGRTLVMCGSVARLSVDQYKHKPRVWVYDTTKRDLKEFFLSIEKGVISHEEHKERRSNEKSLEEFRRSLDTKLIQQSYISRVVAGTKKIKDKSVVKEISSIIQTVTQ